MRICIPLYAFGGKRQTPAAAIAVILVFFFIALGSGVSEREGLSGASYIFKAPEAPGEELIYQWNASDGSPSSAEGRSFSWTAPVVDSPKTVVISLNIVSPSGGCPAKNSIEILLNSQPKPSIVIKKDCIFNAPVRIGDSITYTYNVTNNGNMPLINVVLADTQNWGPESKPV
ncbi:Uncharacterised protein [uncultured archaeon]|nr:Uncharacterised protein [uncultured archaeon]